MMSWVVGVYSPFILAPSCGEGLESTFLAEGYPLVENANTLPRVYPLISEYQTAANLENLVY